MNRYTLFFFIVVFYHFTPNKTIMPLRHKGLVEVKENEKTLEQWFPNFFSHSLIFGMKICMRLTKVKSRRKRHKKQPYGKEGPERVKER